MYSIDYLIQQAKEIHGDKYLYDTSTYRTKTEKMKIICPDHGEFWQSLQQHINKQQGCPICGKLKTRACFSRSSKLTKDEYLFAVSNKFNNKFTYDLSNYKNLASKITVTCPIHGNFLQNAYSHLNSKYGCKECSYKTQSHNNLSNTNLFIEKAKKIHGDKYDYSVTEYKNVGEKIRIKCPIHGIFKQTPYNHLSGCGCPECGKQKTIHDNKLTNEEFVSRAIKIHNGKYQYEDIYVSYKEKIRIKCPIHGVFEQTPDDHLQGKGCYKCAKQVSKPEEEIIKFCTKYLGTDAVQQRNKLLIHPYELDIYIRSLKYAIEYNGLRWHSEKFGKDKTYHLNKLNACKKRGIKLIQIFEDEYINHRDIVYEKLKHILKLDTNQPKIPGRKTTVIEITNKEAQEFLDKYHIQGYTRSTVYLGCYYNNELIAVMSFKRETKTSNRWELTRFATDYKYICQGVGGKLFNYFLVNYKPDEIKSFADRRWTVDEDNNIYTKLGFQFDSYTNPDYHYFNESDGIIRQHKFGFRKQKLHKKYGLPLSMTEEQMTQHLGYTKIYDCGLIKYIWKK